MDHKGSSYQSVLLYSFDVFFSSTIHLIYYSGRLIGNDFEHSHCQLLVSKINIFVIVHVYHRNKTETQLYPNVLDNDADKKSTGYLLMNKINQLA